MEDGELLRTIQQSLKARQNRISALEQEVDQLTEMVLSERRLKERAQDEADVLRQQLLALNVQPAVKSRPSSSSSSRIGTISSKRLEQSTAHVEEESEKDGSWSEGACESFAVKREYDDETDVIIESHSDGSSSHSNGAATSSGEAATEQPENDDENDEDDIKCEEIFAPPDEDSEEDDRFIKKRKLVDDDGEVPLLMQGVPYAKRSAPSTAEEGEGGVGVPLPRRDDTKAPCYACPFKPCRQTFSTVYKLDTHTFVKHAEYGLVQYSCPKCNEIQPNSSAVLEHLRCDTPIQITVEEYSRLLPLMKKIARVRNFQRLIMKCPVPDCFKRMRLGLFTLNNHMSVFHGRVTKFVCEGCGWGGAQAAGALRHHMTICTDKEMSVLAL